MNWADRPSKTPKATKPSTTTAETAEIVLDTLTCAFIYIESVKRYQKAVHAIVDSEDENYAKARALAWERACSTSIDMLNKAFQDLLKSDTRVNEILAARWDTTEEIIASSIPVLALMQETDSMERNNKSKEKTDE